MIQTKSISIIRNDLLYILIKLKINDKYFENIP